MSDARYLAASCIGLVLGIGVLLVIEGLRRPRSRSLVTGGVCFAAAAVTVGWVFQP